MILCQFQTPLRIFRIEGNFIFNLSTNFHVWAVELISDISACKNVTFNSLVVSGLVSDMKVCWQHEVSDFRFSVTWCILHLRWALILDFLERSTIELRMLQNNTPFKPCKNSSACFWRAHFSVEWYAFWLSS